MIDAKPLAANGSVMTAAIRFPRTVEGIASRAPSFASRLSSTMVSAYAIPESAPRTLPQNWPGSTRPTKKSAIPPSESATQ